MSLSRVRVAQLARRVSPSIPRSPLHLPLRCPRRPFYSSSSRRSYHPGYFRFLDDIPQDTVFWGIIGVNGIVFATAWWARKKLEVERDPALYKWLHRNFTSSWNNIAAGRIWTPITAAFTHFKIDHILFNGFTFYFMSPLALSILGSRQFLFLYLGGAASSALGSVAYSNIWRNRDQVSCGASGAIYSTLTFLAFSAPRMTLLLYGVIPMPIYLAVGGLFAYDLYRTAADNGGETNHSAHVGGALAGAAYFFLRRFRMF